MASSTVTMPSFVKSLALASPTPFIYFIDFLKNASCGMVGPPSNGDSTLLNSKAINYYDYYLIYHKSSG
jgi:hypothetical protein